jgi:hypothetical protein
MQRGRVKERCGVSVYLIMRVNEGVYTYMGTPGIIVLRLFLPFFVRRFLRYLI